MAGRQPRPINPQTDPRHQQLVGQEVVVLVIVVCLSLALSGNAPSSVMPTGTIGDGSNHR